MQKGERAGKFWFSPDVPDEVKSSCKDVLLRNEYLIPNWCNEVRIFWNAVADDTNDGTVAAYIDTSYAYRYASIFICPPFLNEELDDREIRIKHELCHIVSTPLVSYVRDVSNILGVEETTAQLVARESSEKVESMTEDLVYILMKMEDFYAKKYSKK
jgi:hypothetical protein